MLEDGSIPLGFANSVCVSPLVFPVKDAQGRILFGGGKSFSLLGATHSQ